MAVNIHKDLDIKNFNANGTNIKITQYADDTVLNLQVIRTGFSAFRKKSFLCLGLKVNKPKIEAIQLGLCFT